MSPRRSPARRPSAPRRVLERGRGLVEPALAWSASAAAWPRRARELAADLAELTEPTLAWSALAAAAALLEPQHRERAYLACDAAPDGDTFMGTPAPPPAAPVDDAIARARAAQLAVRELDGTLPGQPLAVALPGARAARPVPSSLAVAAFAVADRCLVARLDDPQLPAQLAAVVAGSAPPPWRGELPFVCVALGEEPLGAARHGHRRAWTANGGPWLGLGRADGLDLVTTCHLVVDGYGHARLCARLAELTNVHRAHRAAASAPRGEPAALLGGRPPSARPPLAPAHAHLPPLARVPGAVPLQVHRQELSDPAGRAPRLLPLAYHLGCLLHRRAGRPHARHSPTLQIPVARGDRGDPLRLRRRVTSAAINVHFFDGAPEPFERFAARARALFAREAQGRGLSSRLLAAVDAVPVPVAWKRRSIGATRPAWLDSLAEVLGGRALLSRIGLDFAAPHLYAASSPARLATPSDPNGGCVLTLIDDGQRAAITLCGSGTLADPALLAALLADAGQVTARPRAETAGG